MEKDLKERTIAIGKYVEKTKTTIRKAAKHFGISKSTVHKDISERLMYFDKNLYKKIKKILNKNKSERHIRGGMATKKKYCNKEN